MAKAGVESHVELTMLRMTVHAICKVVDIEIDSLGLRHMAVNTEFIFSLCDGYK